MSSPARIWTAAVVGLVVGLALGGGAAYLVSQQQAAVLKTQLSVSNAQRIAAEQKATQAESRAAAAMLAASKSSTSASQQTQSTSSSSATTKTVTPAKPKTVKEYAFVKKIAKSGSAYTLTADYAEFLTGKAAAKAAKDHGDESPPPNDYYIVNDNPLLRKVPVKSGTTVTLIDKADGTQAPNGYDATMAQWTALMNGSMGQRFKDVGYWLTVTDGVVTHVAEQWVP